MTTQITLRFTTQNGEYPGAYFRDYFNDDGLARARAASTTTEAYEIIESTYRGPDVDGIGVTWKIDANIDNMKYCD